MHAEKRQRGVCRQAVPSALLERTQLPESHTALWHASVGQSAAVTQDEVLGVSSHVCDEVDGEYVFEWNTTPVIQWTPSAEHEDWYISGQKVALFPHVGIAKLNPALHDACSPVQLDFSLNDPTGSASELYTLVPSDIKATCDALAERILALSSGR